MLQASSFVASLVLLIRSLPPVLRATRFGMVYAVSIAAFGGTAQIVFVSLIQWTGEASAPGWYLAGMNLLCVPAALGLPDVRARSRRATPGRRRP
jgi:hypothetical protein